MFNLIQTAYADTAAAGSTAAGGGSSTILMIVLMIAIFYFLLIRPENKRKKEAEQMRSGLKKGDWLTTIGGVYGRVVAITDRTVVIETSEDRVRVEFLKSAIGQGGTLDEQAPSQYASSSAACFTGTGAAAETTMGGAASPICQRMEACMGSAMETASATRTRLMSSPNGDGYFSGVTKMTFGKRDGTLWA